GQPMTLAQVQAWAASETITGTSTGPLVVFVNASQTPWTSGDLETDYLGITSFANGSPPNPLSAWLPATQTFNAVRRGVTGYWVVQADVGQYTLPTLGGGPQPDVFSLTESTVPGIATGGLIVADLYTGPNHTLDVTTAQSGALFIGNSVPAPIA